MYYYVRADVRGLGKSFSVISLLLGAMFAVSGRLLICQATSITIEQAQYSTVCSII